MLSVLQVAQRCGVSTDAVRRAIRRGELPATKVFGRVRITEADLEQYVARGTVGGRPVQRRRPTARREARPGGLTALVREQEQTNPTPRSKAA